VTQRKWLRTRGPKLSKQNVEVDPSTNNPLPRISVLTDADENDEDSRGIEEIPT